MDKFAHWPKPDLLLLVTCVEILSWINEVWMENHLVSDDYCNIVNYPLVFCFFNKEWQITLSVGDTTPQLVLHKELELVTLNVIFCVVVDDITLFRPTTEFCGTEIIPWIFPTSILNVKNIRKYYVEYCQSDRRLLWIWMMLWKQSSFKNNQLKFKTSKKAPTILEKSMEYTST